MEVMLAVVAAVKAGRYTVAVVIVARFYRRVVNLEHGTIRKKTGGIYERVMLEGGWEPLVMNMPRLSNP